MKPVMVQARSVVFLFFLLYGLASCGSSINSLPTNATASGLKGNWLVTTDLPIFPPLPLSQRSFGLAMTLDVIQGQVVASSSHFYPCGNGSAVGGSGGLAPATIAADGSFTLQTVQLNGLLPTVFLSIHGSVPQTAGGSWSGSYSATNANAGCLPVAGTFTAVPIQAVNGIFSGTGSLGPSGAVSLTPVTLAITLQQGGPASLDPPLGNSPVNSVNALSGTISIKGSTCFTGGTATTPHGSVFGNRIDAQFTMDDGSTLLLNGSVNDTEASTIVLTSMLVNGGSCNGWSGSFASVLTRQ